MQYLKTYNMDAAELLQWFDDNRDIITVNQAEKESGMTRGTLSMAINGKRSLPSKYIEPLTILMDSLTTAPKKEMLQQKPEKVAAVEVKPVKKLQHEPKSKPTKDTVTYITLPSGIRVRFGKKQMTHSEKHSGSYTLIKTTEGTKGVNGSTIRLYTNGNVFMRAGNCSPSKYAYSLEELQ